MVWCGILIVYHTNYLYGNGDGKDMNVIIDKIVNNFKSDYNLRYLIWMAAIVLASISGWYSIYGMASLFHSPGYEIYIMATALEFSKLIIAVYLHRHWKDTSNYLKPYLVTSLIVLMTITSSGVYGFLTASFSETSSNLRKSEKIVELNTKKIEIFNNKKNDIDSLIDIKNIRKDKFDNLLIQQESANINSIKRKRTIGTNLANSESRSIDSLLRETSKLQDSVLHYTQLSDSMKISQDIGELGPLVYLSNVINVPVYNTIQYFIILIVSVFDPLAIILVFIGDQLTKLHKKSNLEKSKNNNDTVDNFSLVTDNNSSYIEPSIDYNDDIPDSKPAIGDDVVDVEDFKIGQLEKKPKSKREMKIAKQDTDTTLDFYNEPVQIIDDSDNSEINNDIHNEKPIYRNYIPLR